MFISPLIVRQVEDSGNLWELEEPLRYLGHNVSLAVPAGYVTDFASIPRLLWTLFPQSGRWDKAAVVHDYLITDWLTAHPRRVSPAHVDEEFRHALRDCRVGFVRRWLMWAGVRWAAVLNPTRRAGWLRTVPHLLFVTATALAPFAAVLALFL